jgi:hypothetical protein
MNDGDAVTAAVAADLQSHLRAEQADAAEADGRIHWHRLAII